MGRVVPIHSCRFPEGLVWERSGRPPWDHETGGQRGGSSTTRGGTRWGREGGCLGGQDTPTH